MPCQIIATGMKESPRGRGRVHSGPKIALKPIAGGAAVDQIIQIIPAASRTRLEMIDIEAAASLGLVNTTITATRVVPAAHHCAPLLLIHC